MILNFFKQTLPQVIIIIIVLAISLWIKSILSVQLTPFYFESISMPFFSIITNWITGNVLWGRIISFFVLLFTGFYLLQINSKHIVIKQRTYLLSFFYIIIISSVTYIQQLNPGVFAAFCIVFAIDHILSIYHKEQTLDNLFKAGFFVALASLFYAPSIFYFIAIILSIISIRSFNLREWFAAIFGLLTPLFFYTFYFYFVKNDLYSAYNLFKINLFTEVNSISNPMLYIIYGFGILLFMVTGVYLVKTLSAQKISVRKFHGVFFWFNLVSILIIILIPCVSIEIIFLALIPITFQYTHFFTTTNKKFWPNLLFLLVLVFALLLQFYPGEV